MSSGLTEARSAAGAPGSGLLPALLVVSVPVVDEPAPAFAVVGVVGAVAAPVFVTGATGATGALVAAAPVVAGALSLGPAATLAARSNEDITTTVEVARIRTLQPALAGDLDRTLRRTRTGAFSCGMLQL
jgi:hypothetical protein